MTTTANKVSEAEWAARVQLAAAYRIFDHLGWGELIYNHISMRVPGPDAHFLLNPFGLHYSEVRASNLVKVDVRGNVIGHRDWPINPAGFTFHGKIHETLPDAHCVMHVHTTPTMAVCCLGEGLSGREGRVRQRGAAVPEAAASSSSTACCTAL